MTVDVGGFIAVK